MATKDKQVPIVGKEYSKKAETPKEEASPKEDEVVKGAPDLSVLINWRDVGRENARTRNWEYFVIDQFYKGNHNVKGNPNDNSITISKSSESINFPINKIYAASKALRAYVTRHKPMVEVEPEESKSDDALKYARRSNAILDRDNQLNNFRKISKEWVYYGLHRGVGYRQVGYDSVKKCAIRWTVDPWDLLVISKTGEIEDSPAIIKTVTRTIGYLKNKFGDVASDLAPDNDLADDEYKKLALEIENQGSQVVPNNTDDQTKRVYEAWYRIFKPNSQGGLINKCIFVEEKPLHFEETPFNEYPFIPYKAEVSPNDAHPDGVLKQALAPQRMINLLNTQMLEYNHIVNRGRFLKDKNAGFKVITTKEGQIIERNAGKRVEVLNPPAINPMLQSQLTMALEFFDDLTQQHSAARGALPERVVSGDAIEALQSGDTNNLSDLRDNFEDALALEAAWVLKMYSIYEGEGVVVKAKLQDGKEDEFVAMGAEAIKGSGKKAGADGTYFVEENSGYYDVCSILPENNVKVSVTSALGETRGARLSLLFKLVEAGLPLKFLLEHLEFPNTTDIFERIGEEALAELMLEKMKQPPMPGVTPGFAGDPAEAGGPPPPDPQMMQELEAMNSEVGGMVDNG